MLGKPAYIYTRMYVSMRVHISLDGSGRKLPDKDCFLDHGSLVLPSCVAKQHVDRTGYCLCGYRVLIDVGHPYKQRHCCAGQFPLQGCISNFGDAPFLYHEQP